MGEVGIHFSHFYILERGMAGIPWDTLIFPVITLAAGGAGGWFFTMLRRGVSATVAEIAAKEEERIEKGKAAPAIHASGCVQPCGDHLILRTETKTALDSVWSRVDSLTQSVQNDILPILSDVRADMAFIKARMDKKHAAEHLSTMAKEVQNHEPLLLFVDDRAPAMRALITMIEEVGFDVTVAESEEEARALMGAIGFHYAIIDASLDTSLKGSTPTLDGIRLAEWASKVFPALRVFVYSGWELETIPAHCRFFNKQDFKLLLEALRVERERHQASVGGSR